MNIDKRGVLDEEVFTYRIFKDNKVFIYWHGKHITTLSGDKAREFEEDILGLEGKEAQLIMAKVTGHFKHGNERVLKHR